MLKINVIIKNYALVLKLKLPKILLGRVLPSGIEFMQIKKVARN